MRTCIHADPDSLEARNRRTSTTSSTATKHMDTAVLILAIMTATMFAVTFHAWRLGNEKRDVALLGAVGGVCGVGTAVVAIL